MTDIIKDLQKQYPGSNLVTLFELQMPDGSTIYFTPGVHANTANITFDGNTYQPIPVMLEGLEISSDGAAGRPTLTIANVLRVFKDELGASYTYDDMLGKKLTRRRTLSAYLTSSPAVEYPKDIYYIDRVAEKSIISVVFELASPFDLEGVTLPSRIVMGGGCPWKYQGAAPDVTSKDGGCIWSRFSTVIVNGTSYTNYVNVNDEPVVISTSVVGAWAGSGTTGNVYSTSKTGLTKIENNGVFTYNSTSSDYWQCLRNTSNTPSDANTGDFRRVRIYTTYSNSATYNVYTDPSYNAYVANTYDGGTRLFKKRYVTQANTAQGADPGYNEHWEIADVCGKRLFSCTRRFQYKPGTSNGQTVANTTYDQTITLPFGGFPGSRTYS